jgi:hypothetical protein
MIAYRLLLEEKPLSEAWSSAWSASTSRRRSSRRPGAAVDATCCAARSRRRWSVNRIIDNAGATFFPELLASTRRSASEIAEAYFLALPRPATSRR